MAEQVQVEDVKELSPEVVEQETALVKQTAGGGIMDLVLNEDKALALVKARGTVVRTARQAALALTEPEDWLFFRDPDGRETGYLQDCGCDRARDIFGVEIFNVEKPERMQMDGGAFMYVITGDGRCKLTGQVVESMEGGRSSIDDFIITQKNPPKGPQLELLVRKSARANLDGNITRELTGLKSVPIQEIADSWSDQAKKSVFKARVGRGYGGEKFPGSSMRGKGSAPAAPAASRPAQEPQAQPQQQTATPAAAPSNTPYYSQDYKPECGQCNTVMKYKADGKFGAFWFCPKCPQGTKGAIINAAKWHDQLEKEREAENGNGREPGQ